MFWTVRDQIQNCTPGTDVPRLAKSSSPEEWERTARVLFQNKRFPQAMHCFERAGLSREMEVARAYYLREQARSTLASGAREQQLARQKAFILAAEAFKDCALSAVNQKEYRAYHRSAGECFEKAGNDPKAAQAYVAAQEFTDGVKLYKKCGMFDEAVGVIKDHEPYIPMDLVSSVYDIARLVYFKESNFE